jgi:DNA-binding transcriptional regulator LsrR (DeoR family)
MIGIGDGRLLVKVARLYYDQDLTQAEIAERLRLTRQKVQRMLRQARESGIVQIKINPVFGTCSHLERALEDQFQLAEAVVVETTAYDNQAVVAREIGAGAAAYLLRVVRSNDKIVISWGNSLLGMVHALPYPGRTQACGIQVIQGLGGLGDPNHEIHATQLVRRAAGALNAQAILLPAPAVVGSGAAREAFASDRYVRQVLEKGRAADLAFVGIGSSAAETILVPEFWNIMTPGTLSELKKRGAVGSINLRYFDEHGRTTRSELDSCVIGLTLEELKKIYRVVAIAGGSAKLRAIRAALNGRLVNVLVTDHLTAQALLETKDRVFERGLHGNGPPLNAGTAP